MKLTEEQFLQTIVSLGCGNENSIRENRATVRMPTGTRVTIIPCSETGRRELTTVLVLTLAETGIGILNGIAMRVGDQFILRLPSTIIQPAAAILCSVVHSQRASTGMYAISAQFTRMLTVRNEQIGDPQLVPKADDLDDQGLAHLREVDKKLSHWGA